MPTWSRLFLPKQLLRRNIGKRAPCTAQVMRHRWGRGMARTRPLGFLIVIFRVGRQKELKTSQLPAETKRNGICEKRAG
ncbi:hypothetical protein DL89DRAFT_170456 [Linderina pennispora]|uniref:Uncharacterized protein n=1 Tax=Linderina pennispora TaxID=61395 RepID=A0A1Y1W6B2_9FUNG|nr:uncharacterized protein DL89DRAFT_170456 [Linderina pennispora]ORX69051.1 hypothetical protein DL89DRAFT_170456 [Linderina pennispora]